MPMTSLNPCAGCELADDFRAMLLRLTKQLDPCQREFRLRKNNSVYKRDEGRAGSPLHADGTNKGPPNSIWAGKGAACRGLPALPLFISSWQRAGDGWRSAPENGHSSLLKESLENLRIRTWKVTEAPRLLLRSGSQSSAEERETRRLESGAAPSNDKEKRNKHEAYT